MSLDVTALYSVILATVLLVLWTNVVKKRAALSVSIGNGGDDGLHEKIRRHGNFIEWVPIVLFMLMLAELRGVGATWLHLVGVLLVVGRLIHPIGLRVANVHHPLRIIGNMGALIALVVLVIGIIGTLF